MNWSSIRFDWNQARAFLATAEEGSLSAAARVLGQTQPTIGRQITALEQALGVTLFERVGRSMTPTASGLALLDHVRTMAEAAFDLTLTASGQAQTIEGRVVISTTDVMAVYFLPPILEKIRKLAPGIELEIVASNALSDLKRREADIAIRHVRPSQPDLIAQWLCDMPAHLYGQSDYLDRLGRPVTVEALSTANYVRYAQDERIAEMLTGMGIVTGPDNFKLTSETGLIAWEMIRQGLALGFMVDRVADQTPGMEKLLPHMTIGQIPIWLATHRELNTSRRIRVVFDVLAENLSEL